MRCSVSHKIFFVILLIAFSLTSFSVSAITVSGSIQGVVSDPNGAVIKDAAITVKNVTTNQTYSAVTDNQGRYKIENLPIGTYILTVNANSFNLFVKENIVVEDGKSVMIDAKLEIAPIETEVTVGPTKAKMTLFIRSFVKR